MGRRGLTNGCVPTPTPMPDRAGHLLVLGIISAPPNSFRRSWLRQTVFHFPDTSATVMRFVLGTPPPSRRRATLSLFKDRPEEELTQQCAQLGQEVELGDTVVLDAVDNAAVGCVDKTFAWYIHAVRAFPAAGFIGKTDDDSYNILPNLAAVLRAPPLRRQRFAYVGWVQHAAWLPALFNPCAWSGSQRAAVDQVASGRSNCHRCAWCYDRDSPHPNRAPLNQTVEGPFPFVAGPLEILSRRLTAAVFGSQWTASFALEARSVARGGHRKPFERWQCFYEDATVGYAVHSVAGRLGLNVSVVSLRPRIIDAGEARNMPSEQIRRLVTVHKLEPDDSVLKKNEAYETEENARYRKMGIPTAMHKHDHAAMNRRVKPILDGMAAPPQPDSAPMAQWDTALRCASRGFIEGALGAQRRLSVGGGRRSRVVRPHATPASHDDGGLAHSPDWVGSMCWYH